MITNIKIYGERNTSTNYVEKLLEQNVDIDILPSVVPDYVRTIQNKLSSRELVRDIYFKFTFNRNLGWKHSCVLPEKTLKKCSLVNEKLLFVTITKNPYSWLLSMYRKPYHQYYKSKPSFEEFLQKPWKTVGRDNVGVRQLATPVELWNAKNCSYFELDNFKVIHTKSEELLEDPEALINKVNLHLGNPLNGAKFRDVLHSTKEKSKDRTFYQDYYLNEKWKSKLKRKHINLINLHLDKSLMGQFGYDIL